MRVHLLFANSVNELTEEVTNLYIYNISLLSVVGEKLSVLVVLWFILFNELEWNITPLWYKGCKLFEYPFLK